MGLMDRVKAFFEKEPQARALSSSVVTHDRVDDHYLEDFRERATKFEQVFENSPNVPVGAPPKDCPSCGEEAVLWAHEDGKLVCPECQHEVAMPESPYTLWPDLVKDAFRSYFTYNDPQVRAEPEVKDSHELHRRIMSRVLTGDDFLDTRPMTRTNDVESAWASMSLLSGLGDELREGTLADHARRAQEMAEEQQKIEDYERKLDEMREAFEKGELSPEQLQTADDLASKHGQAEQKLAQLTQEQTEAGIGLDVQEAVDSAVADAHEEAELMSSIPGMASAGAGSNLPPDLMFDLAERFRGSDVMRKVAELMGRLERDMKYKRANRVVGGFEEIVDVELGSNLAVMLPHELMKIGDDDFELEFDRRFLEHAVEQFELRGNEPEGKGPVIVCVDGSGSMSGERNVWARAVSLALINIAHREKRDSAAIEFSSAGDTRAWFFPGREPLNPEHVLEFASHYFGGGTDITYAVQEARQIMERVPEFVKADIAIITDGEDRFADEDRELRDTLRGRGVRMHGIGIGGSYGYLTEMCDHAMHVSELSLDGANEATDALATQIT